MIGANHYLTGNSPSAAPRRRRTYLPGGRQGVRRTDAHGRFAGVPRPPNIPEKLRRGHRRTGQSIRFRQPSVDRGHGWPSAKPGIGCRSSSLERGSTLHCESSPSHEATEHGGPGGRGRRACRRITRRSARHETCRFKTNQIGRAGGHTVHGLGLGGGLFGIISGPIAMIAFMIHGAATSTGQSSSGLSCSVPRSSGSSSGALEGACLGAIMGATSATPPPRQLTIGGLMLVVAIAGPSLAFLVAFPPFALLCADQSSCCSCRSPPRSSSPSICDYEEMSSSGRARRSAPRSRPLAPMS